MSVFRTATGRSVLVLIALFGAIGCGMGISGDVRPGPVASASAGSPLSVEDALRYLRATADLNRRSFVVYHDEGDGTNHFAPSGWMGDYGDLIYDGACTTDPAAGATCIRITYLARGSGHQDWAGICWQATPGDWGLHGGYDLRGATTLRFKARGARGGEKIKFSCGGLNRPPHHQVELPEQDSFGPLQSATISLKKSWTEYQIPLRGHDLSNCAGGFAFTTNIHMNPRGCTFYIDEIAYDLSRDSVLSLAPSYTDLPWPRLKYLGNVAFVYDEAVLMLALLATGDPGDVRRAVSLADCLCYAQDNDRLFSDGRLRNGYATGDLVDLVTRRARLPGWWDRDESRWFEDRQDVSTHSGNLAWAGIAFLEVYESTGDSKYLSAARRFADWIQVNCADENGFGGYTGGFDGWEAAKGHGGQMKLDYKSVEMNLDIYVFFARLSELTSEPEWLRRAFRAKHFVAAMWDSTAGHFWTGTRRVCRNEDTTFKGARPLDVNTWGLLALGEPDRYGRAMSWASDSCFVPSCPRGCGDEGFDFNSDRDGVWHEGTAQGVLAWEQLGKTGEAEALWALLRRAGMPSSRTGLVAIPAACHDSLSTGFDWLYHKDPSLAATAWFVLAGLHHNPYWGTRTGERVPYEGAYR